MGRFERFERCTCSVCGTTIPEGCYCFPCRKEVIKEEKAREAREKANHTHGGPHG